MLKSRTNKTGAMALAAVMAAGVFMTGGTAVHAAAPANGTTPVTYENRTVLPDGNAQYGVIIPTAVSFTDASKTANADLEITGIGGYDLDTNWTALQVTASVASTNGYKLKTGVKEVDYKIKMNGNAGDFDSSLTTPTDAQEITTKLGVGGANVKKVTGTAELTGVASSKGSYSDTLTYSFVENTNTPK